MNDFCVLNIGGWKFTMAADVFDINFYIVCAVKWKLSVWNGVGIWIELKVVSHM